ncbi:hypothetical protein OG422_30690 [Streptomyces sp. NBC_01525]|uniref:hypothetical protein n=1 Tax=Streptomyces sp. NBC_01525 TaxID=2903893 RepID=UPI003863B559
MSDRTCPPPDGAEPVSSALGERLARGTFAVGQAAASPAAPSAAPTATQILPGIVIDEDFPFQGRPDRYPQRTPVSVDLGR